MKGLFTTTVKFCTQPRVWLKLLIAFQLVLLGLQFYPQLCTNGDNAVYYLLGKALAGGEGFRNIQLWNQPVESTVPIGFPLLISLTQLFTHTPLVPKIFMGVLGILVTLGTFHLFKDDLEPPLLAAVTGLVALSGLLAEYNVILMSETPYNVALLASFLVVKAYARQPGSGRLFWAAVLLALFPLQVRSIGLLYSCALIAWAVTERKWSFAWAHGLLTVLVLILAALFSPETTTYVRNPFLKNVYDPEMGAIQFSGLVARIFENIRLHLFILFPRAFLPSVGPPQWRILWSICARIFFVAVCVGWVRHLRGFFRIAAYYVLLYVGVIFFWHAANDRRIVCMLPFLFFFGVEGLRICVLAFDPSRNYRSSRKALSHPRPLTHLRLAAIGVCVMLAAGYNVVHQVRLARAGFSWGHDWDNYFRCGDWIREHTAPDACVMSRKQELLFLHSQRRGCNYPYSHDVEKVMAHMRQTGVTHVIVDNFNWTRTTARYLFPAILANAEQFEVVYALKDPYTFILEFKDRAPPAPQR